MERTGKRMTVMGRREMRSETELRAAYIDGPSRVNKQSKEAEDNSSLA
jgi:hypothetical protein